MGRMEDALARISEQIGWREDLIDTEANAVLKWVESKLAQIDAEAASTHDFNARVEAVRGLLAHINDFVGKRPTLSPEQQQTALDSMAQAASVTPIPLSDLDTHGFSAQAAGNDNLPLIGALTTWLDGGELPTAPVDDGRAETGTDAQADAQAAPPAEPTPPPDPNALSAFMGFFNTAPDPDSSDEPPASSTT